MAFSEFSRIERAFYSEINGKNRVAVCGACRNKTVRKLIISSSF